MKIDPYLHFEGRCEEAIEFYKKELGAKVNFVMRFKEAPAQPSADCKPPAGIENKIMHGDLSIGESTLLVSDGRCQGSAKFEGVSLTLKVKDDAEAKQKFDALSQGGHVSMPLAKTFFSSSFGMLADKFGVHWIVIVPTE
jgi:PhnB protein